MMTDPGLPVPEPTKSYWQEAQKSNLANVRSKTLLPETDIVVIGSGITGCSVTHWLLAADDNVKVMVLEARTLCSGATGRNGGNIKATAVMDYFNLRKKHSHEIATKIVEFTLAHFASLVSSAKELDVKILEEGEIRQVETVMGIIDPARLDEAKEALEFFEKNWPEMRGIHKLYGQEDAQKVGSNQESIRLLAKRLNCV
jgi:glycine/D-amino acid oxidase-like deaminating enzyme